jgi:thiol-disulfide isomerase/thioredoxin
MKTKKTLNFILLVTLFLGYINVGCQSSKNPIIPKIKYGKAVFSGRFIGNIPSEKSIEPLALVVPEVVTGLKSNYEIPVKADGTFSITVDVHSITVATLVSDYFNGPVCLLPGEETKFEISFKNNQKDRVEIFNSIGFKADDAENMIDYLIEYAAVDYKNDILSPKEYSQLILEQVPGMLKKAEDANNLSDVAKQIVLNELKLMIINFQLFNYEGYAKFTNSNMQKKDTTIDFKPQVPEKDYYKFLQYFNLNDPSYLFSASLPNVMRSILDNQTLAIPVIGDAPIIEWIKNASETLKDLVGFESGLFYEILACNAFGKQFDELKPLSEKQVKNINHYFGKKPMTEILVNESKKVEQIIAGRQNERVFILDKFGDDALKTIKERYKGKVIFIDIWATWCSPCLAAIRESKPVKDEFSGKDVVFVFLTNQTSPRSNWEQRIAKIDGEHYYLHKQAFDKLDAHIGIEGFPQYLVYDKAGNLRYNKASFMGNDMMRKLIGDLLD